MFKRIIAAGLTAAAISGTAVAPASAYTVTVTGDKCSISYSARELQHLRGLRDDAEVAASQFVDSLGKNFGPETWTVLRWEFRRAVPLKDEAYEISRERSRELSFERRVKVGNEVVVVDLVASQSLYLEINSPFLHGVQGGKDFTPAERNKYDETVPRFRKFLHSYFSLDKEAFRNCGSGTSVNREFDFATVPNIPDPITMAKISELLKDDGLAGPEGDVKPGGSGNGDGPAVPEGDVKPGGSEGSDKPDVPAVPEGDVKPGGSEGSDKPDVPAKPEGDVKPGGSEGSDKPDAPAKPEGDVKPGGSEGSDKPDVPAKPEDGAKPAGNGLVKDGQLTPGGIALVAGGVVAGVLALAAAVFPLILPMLPAGLQAMISGILPF
ncbi:hypothetical protein [Corynebacterium phocae]|uniref:hypothetical protein n=1 Tax=Corynebacterium phocae TaxID=161895 RepID=UPI001239DE9B|nr:hypothetical protein [Corynebacterium phocae]KAA8723717.1 hypothetical protein F4V58_06400 [Corynebacterium phocae]